MSKATYVPPGCETGVIIGQKAEIDRLRARIETLEKALAPMIEIVSDHADSLYCGIEESEKAVLSAARAALPQGETK